jgi:hypothetical protein
MNRSARTVEGRQNSVACSLDQASSMPFDQLMRKLIVGVEKLAPTPVTNCF